MTITNNLLTPGSQHGRTGQALSPAGIVVHYVGNPQSSAVANRNWFEAGSSGQYVSSHYVIGLNGEIIRCIPENERAMHAGKSYDKKYDQIAPTNNARLIGIENCHPDASGKFNAKTYESLIWLCADICSRYGFGLDAVYRHYDVAGKICPLYYVNNTTEWQKLKNDIAQKLNKRMTPEEKLAVLIKDSAINTPQYWINALKTFRYFDGFVDAIYDKYETNAK